MDPQQAETPRQAIERLNREGDALKLFFRRAHAHLSAAEVDPGDRLEVWGRRIGRGLAMAASLALCIYLYVFYVS